MQKERKNSKLIIIGSLLILMSLFFIGYKYINLSLMHNEESNKIEEFYIKEKDKKELSDKVNSSIEKEISKNNDNYVAILKIPKIKLVRGLVNKESKYNNIQYNVAFHEMSDYPDVDNGNVILMAHSGNAYISYFDSLDLLTVNDEILLDYANKTYIYKIDKIYDVYKSGSLSINRDNKRNTITLITCRNNTNKQIVVIGYLKG